MRSVEGILASLHAGLHADDVADFVLEHLIEADQKIDGAALLRADTLGEESGKLGPGGSVSRNGRNSRAGEES